MKVLILIALAITALIDIIYPLVMAIYADFGTTADKISASYIASKAMRGTSVVENNKNK